MGGGGSPAVVGRGGCRSRDVVDRKARHGRSTSPCAGSVERVPQQHQHRGIPQRWDRARPAVRSGAVPQGIQYERRREDHPSILPPRGWRKS